MRARHQIRGPLAALACLVAACAVEPVGSGYQDSPTGPQPPTSTSQITVKNNWFDPAATTVSVGTTVTWTWDACYDDGYGTRVCVDHSVTFDGGAPSSGTRSSGTYTLEFNRAGTFHYRCTRHSAMTGRVVVR